MNIVLVEFYLNLFSVNKFQFTLNYTGLHYIVLEFDSIKWFSSNSERLWRASRTQTFDMRFIKKYEGLWVVVPESPSAGTGITIICASIQIQ